MPPHPYFGTVLVIAGLAALCLTIMIINGVLDLTEKLARRRNRKTDDATFEAETRRLFAEHGADLGPIDDEGRWPR